MIKPFAKTQQWGPIDARVLWHSFWFLPVHRLTKKHWDAGWPEPTVALTDHDRLTCWWDHALMRKRGARAIELWIKNEAKRTQLWKEYLVKRRDVLRVAQKIVKIMPLHQKNNQKDRLMRRSKLRELGVKWYTHLTEYWTIAVVPEIANFGTPEYLAKALKKYVPKNEMGNALEILLAPERLSFHEQSELALCQALNTVSLNQREKNLETYCKKWHWVENSYYGCKRLTPAVVKRRAKYLAQKEIREKIRGIQNYPRAVKKKKERVARRYRLPQEIKNLARALSFSIWWQDDRKAFIWRANSITDLLTRRAALQFGIPFDNLLYYTAEEWQELLVKAKRLPASAIKARKNFFVIILGEQGKASYSICTGKKARRLAQPFLFPAKPTDTATLKGTTVSKGKGNVVGRVRILASPRNASRMKKGEILVAPMTSPDYIIAMRKALAIVTDVGGLMSHAAVISRELDIPCIVGTEHATQVLKTGDMVKITLEGGVVKKI